MTELQQRYKEAQQSHEELVATRNNLEREIINKRYTLEIDGHVLKEIRFIYPSVKDLSGYID